MRTPILLSALALLACSGQPDRPEAHTQITYSTSRCFGFCPAYTLMVDNSGRPGIFEGEAFTAVEGKRQFAFTTAQFEAFYQAVRSLSSYPAGTFQEGGARCRRVSTDSPTVEVTWQVKGRASETRRFYFGCDRQGNREIADKLYAAPKALPIAAFIEDGLRRR